MKCLTIQIQPQAVGSDNEQAVINQAKALGRFPEIDRITEGGGYTNLNFFSEFLSQLWADLSSLLTDPELGPWLKANSIIVCEGDKGWDDHLLLSHFDPAETLDTLPQE